MTTGEAGRSFAKLTLKQPYTFLYFAGDALLALGADGSYHRLRIDDTRLVLEQSANMLE